MKNKFTLIFFTIIFLLIGTAGNVFGEGLQYTLVGGKNYVIENKSNTTHKLDIEILKLEYASYDQNGNLYQQGINPKGNISIKPKGKVILTINETTPIYFESKKAYLDVDMHRSNDPALYKIDLDENKNYIFNNNNTKKDITLNFKEYTNLSYVTYSNNDVEEYKINESVKSYTLKKKSKVQLQAKGSIYIAYSDYKSISYETSSNKMFYVYELKADKNYKFKNETYNSIELINEFITDDVYNQEENHYKLISYDSKNKTEYFNEYATGNVKIEKKGIISITPNEKMILYVPYDSRNKIKYVIDDIVLTDTEVVLAIDDSYKLTLVNFDKELNNKVIWRSSNSSVVKVSSSGYITALKEGVAEITVSTRDNKAKAKCLVNVLKSNLNRFKEINLEKKVDEDYIFCIDFDKKLSVETLMEKNIYVTDEKDNLIPVYITQNLGYLRENNIYVMPIGKYKKGKYVLWMKDLITTTGTYPKWERRIFEVK